MKLTLSAVIFACHCILFLTYNKITGTVATNTNEQDNVGFKADQHVRVRIPEKHATNDPVMPLKQGLPAKTTVKESGRLYNNIGFQKERRKRNAEHTPGASQRRPRRETGLKIFDGLNTGVLRHDTSKPVNGGVNILSPVGNLQPTAHGGRKQRRESRTSVSSTEFNVIKTKSRQNPTLMTWLGDRQSSHTLSSTARKARNTDSEQKETSRQVSKHLRRSKRHVPISTRLEGVVKHAVRVEMYNLPNRESVPLQIPTTVLGIGSERGSGSLRGSPGMTTGHLNVNLITPRDTGSPRLDQQKPGTVQKYGLLQDTRISNNGSQNGAMYKVRKVNTGGDSSEFNKIETKKWDELKRTGIDTVVIEMRSQEQDSTEVLGNSTVNRQGRSSDKHAKGTQHNGKTEYDRGGRQTDGWHDRAVDDSEGGGKASLNSAPLSSGVYATVNKLVSIVGELQDQQGKNRERIAHLENLLLHHNNSFQEIRSQITEVRRKTGHIEAALDQVVGEFKDDLSAIKANQKEYWKQVVIMRKHRIKDQTLTVRLADNWSKELNEAKKENEEKLSQFSADLNAKHGVVIQRLSALTSALDKITNKTNNISGYLSNNVTTFVRDVKDIELEVASLTSRVNELAHGPVKLGAKSQQRERTVIGNPRSGYAANRHVQQGRMKSTQSAKDSNVKGQGLSNNDASGSNINSFSEIHIAGSGKSGQPGPTTLPSHSIRTGDVVGLNESHIIGNVDEEAASDLTEQPTTDKRLHLATHPTKHPKANVTNHQMTDRTNQEDVIGNKKAYETDDPSTSRTKDPRTYQTDDQSTYPTNDPSTYPTKDPSTYPVNDTSIYPTNEPSTYPTNDPSTYPTKDPSTYLTKDQSTYPTNDPSTYSTKDPSTYPANDTSIYPTNDPYTYPTKDPYTYPTNDQSTYPTKDPSTYPTKDPSTYPTKDQSTYPANDPSTYPTNDPSTYPTKDPSTYSTKDPFTYPMNKSFIYERNEPSTYQTSDPTYQNNSTSHPPIAHTSHPADYTTPQNTYTDPPKKYERKQTDVTTSTSSPLPTNTSEINAVDRILNTTKKSINESDLRNEIAESDQRPLSIATKIKRGPESSEFAHKQLEERIKHLEAIVFILVSANVSEMQARLEDQPMNFLQVMANKTVLNDALRQEFDTYKTAAFDLRAIAMQQSEETSRHQNMLRNLKAKTGSIERDLREKGNLITQLQSMASKMSTMFRQLASQVSSINMTEFILQVKESIANFTQNVLSLDQWKLSQEQMMNSSVQTEDRLSKIMSIVVDNTHSVSKLHERVSTTHNTTLWLYRDLQGYVINLNNSVQDLSERFTRLIGNRYNQIIEAAIPTPPKTLAMLQGLSVQLLYNANRLTTLEAALLNQSLTTCKQSSTQLEQESRVRTIGEKQDDMRDQLFILQDKMKQLDLNLFRLLSSMKVKDKMVTSIQNDTALLKPLVQDVMKLKMEVETLVNNLPRDCNDHFLKGQRQSGIYLINPQKMGHTNQVFCVMEASLKDNCHSCNHGNSLQKDTTSNDISGKSPLKEVAYIDNTIIQQLHRGEDDVKEESTGGWTVIQRRRQGRENFTRSWEDYAHGFGHPVGDYWIGNDAVHVMTSNGEYELRIVMEDTFSETWEARYELFNISSKEDGYRLYVAGYQGNATDSLSDSTRAQFSTYDRDNDSGSSHCARYNGGGWWYSQCHMSNLNGVFDIGMVWFNKEWKDWLQLRETMMLIKPRRIVQYSEG